MTTSSHISSTALGSAHIRPALPAMFAVALIAATGAAWYVILDMALSSIH